MNCMAVLEAHRRMAPSRLTVFALPPTLDHTTAIPNRESSNA